MVDFSVDFLGVRFKNPIVAPSGFVTHTLENMQSCIKAGVGAVTAKSISIDPERTMRRARKAIYFLDKYGRRNIMTQGARCGFNSPEAGLEYLRKISPIAKNENVVLIGNIAGEPPLVEEPLLKLAKAIEKTGVDMLEVTVGCPFVQLSPKERAGLTRDAVTFVLTTLKRELSIPYYLKVFYQSDLPFTEIVDILEKHNTKAFHVSLDIPAAFVDIETGTPVVPVPKLYGPDFTAIGAYFTAKAAQSTNMQIISGGGLWTYRDIVERIMCGATLTAVHTAVMHNGYKVFTQILEGLGTFMERKGYEKIDDFKGVAVPYLTDPEAFDHWLSPREVPAETVTIGVDGEKCNGCGLCTVCNQGAIIVDDGGAANINLELCIRCGVCASICPKDAIIISLP